MGRPIKKKFFGSLNVPAIGGESVSSTLVVGGTNNNYTAIPTFTFGLPELPGGVRATGVVSTMVAKTATVTTSGTGAANADYEPGDVLTVVGGTGTAATFTVASVKIRTAGVQNQGTGTWVTGDTFTFSTGFSTPAVLTVTATAGVIDGITITDAGVKSTALTADPVTPDSTSNGGGVQGVSFNLGFGVNAVTVASAGSYTVLPSNPVATTTDSATGTGATLSVSYGIGTATLTNAGSGYTSVPTATMSGGNGTITASLTNTTQNALSFVAFVPGGSSAVAGDIVKQESSRRYLVTTGQGTGQCRLVATAPGEGEMRLTALDSDGGTYYVLKLSARRALVVRGTGTQFSTGQSVPWTLDAPTANETVSVASV
jgi:hypothetical protein